MSIFFCDCNFTRKKCNQTKYIRIMYTFRTMCSHKTRITGTWITIYFICTCSILAWVTSTLINVCTNITSIKWDVLLLKLTFLKIMKNKDFVYTVSFIYYSSINIFKPFYDLWNCKMLTLMSFTIFCTVCFDIVYNL